MSIHLKKYFMVALLVSVCCTAQREVRSLPAQSSPVPQEIDRIVSEIKLSPDTLSLLSVDHWPGEKFVLLEKPVLFQRHGFEIYRCQDSSNCPVPVDSLVELSNRRIRYDKFVGDTLEAIEIKPEGNEWCITFRDSRYALSLYAKTYKHAIKDVLLLRDLNAAKKRWLGETIFSRKGLISITGENGSLSSKKVSRLDSLKVYEISAGLSPLPVNPIWLKVQTPNNTRGFIPVRISWSNTIEDQIYDGVAWEDDVLEKNPLVEYSWDKVYWELVDNHRIVLEMNKEQVFLSWGRPLRKVTKKYNDVETECWIYSTQELYFSQNSLIAIQDIAIK